MVSIFLLALLNGIFLRAVHPITRLSPTPAFTPGRAYDRWAERRVSKSMMRFQTEDFQSRRRVSQKHTDAYTTSGDDYSYTAHYFPQLVTHQQPLQLQAQSPRLPLELQLQQLQLPLQLQLHSHQKTFKQRFWFDASHYKPGGPVILLDAGETNGQERLGFLHHGILAILAKATHAIAIVLEHRYYGRSFPFEDLSIDSLRYLTTRESLDDSLYFATHISLPGHEHLNITAPRTPWIYYGGSYAGAKSAFMIKLYPDYIWGSLASSAVIHAQVDLWQYYEPIRLSAPKHCIKPLITITKAIDHVLSSDNRLAISLLKHIFGLANVTDDRDFVNTLASPLGSWQERNWDPDVGADTFDSFCEALRDRSTALVLPSPLADLLASREFPLGSFLGYAAFIRDTVSTDCPRSMSQDQCFGTGDTEMYRNVGLNQTWRSWMWQVCTEWGFFQDAAPVGQESLISRLIDLNYSSRVCQFAFGSAVPLKPNVTIINQYGDFNLTARRLEYVDGSDDPWLYATSHSPLHPGRENKGWLIKGGVHHWDENGVAADGDLEPDEIRKVHQVEVGWIKAWLDDFPS